MSKINDVMEEEENRLKELEEEKKRKFMMINGVPISIRKIISDSKTKKRELAEG
jgi:hypothetical protein